MKHRTETYAFLTAYSLLVILPYTYVVGRFLLGVAYENSYYMLAHFGIIILAIYPAWITFEKAITFKIRILIKRGGRPFPYPMGWYAFFVGTYWLVASLLSSFIETTCGDIEMLHISVILVLLPITFFVVVNMPDEDDHYVP